jgi:ribosomal protein S17E
VALRQTVKKSAKVIIERYYPKLTLDFETNKRICDEIAIIASKRLRNKVLLFPTSSCTSPTTTTTTTPSLSSCSIPFQPQVTKI